MADQPVTITHSPMPKLTLRGVGMIGVGVSYPDLPCRQSVFLCVPASIAPSIVKAVNVHDDLVKALKACVEQFAIMEIEGLLNKDDQAVLADARALITRPGVLPAGEGMGET